MNLIDLTKVVENDLDEAFVNAMILESEDTLNKRIGDMLCTYIGVSSLNKETKSKIEKTIEWSNADTFGSVATFVFLISYLQKNHEGHKNIVEMSEGFVFTLVKFLAKDIYKGSLVQRIWVAQETVGISDNFYDELINYFGFHKNDIAKIIMQRMASSYNDENSLNFEKCFEKHFPFTYKALVATSLEFSTEELTLITLHNYNGEYELNDDYMGAYIMHIEIGNIQRFNVDTFIRKLNWGDDFEYDVKFRLKKNNL